MHIKDVDAYELTHSSTGSSSLSSQWRKNITASRQIFSWLYSDYGESKDQGMKACPHLNLDHKAGVV